MNDTDIAGVIDQHPRETLAVATITCLFDRRSTTEIPPETVPHPAEIADRRLGNAMCYQSSAFLEVFA